MLLGLYVVVLLIVIVGATFAYFTTIKVSTSTPQIQSSSVVTNYVTFNTGYDISIDANDKNFDIGMSSITSSTYASAEIRVDNAEDVTSLKYTIYLQIDKNEFTYSTEEKTPELLVQLYDINGSEVTSIDGLEYVTVVDGQGISQSGFDITTLSGTITLVDSYVISTKTEEYQEWNVNVTLVNLDVDQYENAGKGLSGKLVIEKVG